MFYLSGFWTLRIASTFGRFGLMIAITLSVFSTQTPLAAAEAPALKVGYYNFPPHVYAHDQRPSGSKIEFFEQVTGQMGIEEIEYFSYPFKRLLNNIETGVVDVGLFVAKTPERSGNFVFPRVSFDRVPMAIAIDRHRDFSPERDLDELDSWRIGYLADAYIPKIIKDQNVQIEPLHGRDWVQQNISMVLKGRLDAAMSSYYRLVYEVYQAGLEKDVRVIKLPETMVPLYVAFSKKVETDLVESYEKALLKVLAGLSYEEVFNKYMRGPTKVGM